MTNKAALKAVLSAAEPRVPGRRIRRDAVPGPVAPRTWRGWQDIGDLFQEPMDNDWQTDRELLDASPADPWESR